MSDELKQQLPILQSPDQRKQYFSLSDMMTGKNHRKDISTCTSYQHELDEEATNVPMIRRVTAHTCQSTKGPTDFLPITKTLTIIVKT